MAADRADMMTTLSTSDHADSGDRVGQRRDIVPLTEKTTDFGNVVRPNNAGWADLSTGSCSALAGDKKCPQLQNKSAFSDLIVEVHSEGKHPGHLIFYYDLKPFFRSKLAREHNAGR